MLVLLDQGTPRGLIRCLRGHGVFTAKAKGWDRLSNGALLSAAEKAGFDVLVTTDHAIRYQQDLSTRKIALVVLTGSTKWSRVSRQASQILEAVNGASAGTYEEVEISFE